VPLKDALASALSRLTAESVPSPRMNAELLLMFTLGCDRAYLYAHPERELTAAEEARYETALGERARGVPAQYITGHQEFWGMDLIVSPAVLIPRPETEHVVEVTLKLAADLGAQALSAGAPERLKLVSPSQLIGTAEAAPSPSMHKSGLGQTLRIVDVGTGSGCIALALAKELPHAEIHATDISASALEIARANASRHQLAERVRFHQADLLAGFAPESVDFVASNPPYVGTTEEDQVQLEVRKFEPRMAVFAGATGLEVIERLVPQARAVLRPGGWLVIEISASIADGVHHLLRDWRGVSVTNDLQGIPRVASARKP